MTEYIEILELAELMELVKLAHDEVIAVNGGGRQVGHVPNPPGARRRHNLFFCGLIQFLEIVILPGACKSPEETKTAETRGLTVMGLLRNLAVND